MKINEGFVESEGHRLGYLSVNEHLLNQNEQPIIVFIHGFLASINFWRDCVPPSFKEDRAWYSLSLPAHNPKAYGANPLSQRMLDNIKPNVSQQNYSDLFPLLNGITRLEIADQLEEINIPCYIFACTHDQIVLAKQSLLLSSKIPNAKTVVFHNVGHMPFIEDPDNYFSALEDAISSIIKQSINR